jgi:hypothetical protein
MAVAVPGRTGETGVATSGGRAILGPMPLPRHPAALTATLSMAAAVSPAVAQFTADAATPAPLASGPSEQVQPKVVPIPAGGFYM